MGLQGEQGIPGIPGKTGVPVSDFESIQNCEKLVTDDSMLNIVSNLNKLPLKNTISG